MANFGKFYGYSLVIKDSVLNEYRMLKRPPIADGDDGNGVFVKHADCKSWMSYHEDDEMWICPICGAKLKHSVAYDYIEELNKEGQEYFDRDYEEYW